MADFDPTDLGEEPAADDPLGLDGEDGEGDGLEEALNLRDALLFVIDCTCPGALQPARPDGRSPVAEALAAAAAVLKTKVVTSPDDKVGVLFYGVREHQNPHDFAGIRLLQDLDRPSAGHIRALELEAKRTPAQFEERYGHCVRVPVSDVFWTCTTVFNLSANPKQYQPRMFLFTGNDRPSDSAVERDVAERRAKDMLELGVEVEFFPLPAVGQDFSIEAFWGRVLPVDEMDYITQASVKLEELERRVRRRVHRKRTLQRLVLEICPGVQLGIAVYCRIIQAAVPPPVRLHNETNSELKSEMKLICEQTGSILHPADDVETFCDVLGERVQMTRAEVDEIKRAGEPGMTLLGFKPAATLKAQHRIFHSYFVYPNERAVTGSAAFCAALIGSMTARKVVAIVRYVARRNSPSVLAALVPQAETEDETGDQARAPGFHMILLPWGEDIRDLKFPSPAGAEVGPELVESARRVVTTLRLDGFAPGLVENTVLQRHFAAVQALALGEDQPEETRDMLQPDEDFIREQEPLFTAWSALLDGAAGALGVGAPSMGGKRKLAEGEAEEPRPRARRATESAADAAELTMEAMRAKVLSGEVERLTVQVLRDWLKAQGVTASGKKGDLVGRVRAVV